MAKSGSIATGLAVFAFVLAIIAIFITIILYFIPRPIIDDSTPENNTTFSSNKINTLIKGVQDQIDTLQKEVDGLKIENTNLKNYIGILPAGTPIGMTVVKYFMDRIGDINPSTSVVDYINVQVLNNSAFITKIVTDKDFNTNVANESIRQFFGTNNTNTISLINVDDIIVNNSLKPLDKSKVDIQSTRLMTVPFSRFNDSGQYLCLIEGTRPKFLVPPEVTTSYLSSATINPSLKLVNNTNYGSSGPGGLVKSVDGFSLVSVGNPIRINPLSINPTKISNLKGSVKCQMYWKVDDGTNIWDLTTNTNLTNPRFSIIDTFDGTNAVYSSADKNLYT